MGQLYKRGGAYYADYIDRDNIRQRKSTRTKDLKVAKSRLRDLELQTTDRGSHKTEGLEDALDYFTGVAMAGRAKGTIRCYEQKSRHVSRLLGHLRCDRLRREDVDRFIATRIKEGAHSHSVHKELVVLRGSLKAARQRGVYHGLLDVVPPFDAGYVPRTTYLTPDEFIALIENLVKPLYPKATEHTIQKVERLKQQRALYCMLIALASPRLGEVEKLEWTHVDLARNVIRIPKGKTIGRPIAIHPVLRPWLEALHAGHGHVVEPWSSVGRDLPAAAKRAGLKKHVTTNDLRRTFASWLVQAGVSLYVVSRLLGHKSTRMVELVYGQLDEETLLAAIAKLPGCDAGVPDAVLRKGIPGAGGTTHAPLSIVNSIEMALTSTETVVPRNGIEPPTRGFSVLRELAPKRATSQPKLALVK